MKSLLLLFVLLSTSAQALIIKGEESNNHFIKVKPVGNMYQFLECSGDYTNYACDDFFEEPTLFTEKDILIIASSKRSDIYISAAVDVAIFVVAIKTLPFLAANAEKAHYLAKGFSMDGGVGALSGAGAALATTIVVPAVTLAIDVLDPWVHNDLSLGLSMIVGDVDFDDREEIQERSEVLRTEAHKEVTMEDITTQQVVDSYTRLLNIIRDNRERSKKNNPTGNPALDNLFNMKYLN